MTTNGVALHRRLPALVESGLTHLNLSLDTLDPFKFEIITRRRGHDAVLKALDTALSLPIESVKLNVVVIRGLNDLEVLDFIKLTEDKPISVRFIEFMPFTGSFHVQRVIAVAWLTNVQETSGIRKRWFLLPNFLSALEASIRICREHQMNSTILRVHGRYPASGEALDLLVACRTISAVLATDYG